MTRSVSVYGIDRGLWDHPVFDDEPYTQKQGWAWLVGAAAYQEKRVRGPRGPVKLQRGEFTFSVRFLAEKWLWSKSRVDRFLDMLCKRDMLRDDMRDGTKVYIILNYNKFQIVKAPKRDSERDTLREVSGTAAGQQRDKEKDTEDREDNKSLSRALHEEFEKRFWPICPKKVGKALALKAFLKARKTVELEKLLAGMRRYALSRAGLDDQYTAHAASWLNAGRWDDEQPQIIAANGHDPPALSDDRIAAAQKAEEEHRRKKAENVQLH